jgi:hypothetical protein
MRASKNSKGGESSVVEQGSIESCVSVLKACMEVIAKIALNSSPALAGNLTTRSELHCIPWTRLRPALKVKFWSTEPIRTKQPVPSLH